MKIDKKILEQDVLDASMERIKWTLEKLSESMCLFGWKRFSIMLNLTAQLARQLKKKINILFIDWEAQFSYTIEYVERMAVLNTAILQSASSGLPCH